MTPTKTLSTAAASLSGLFAASAALAHDSVAPHTHVGDTAVFAGPVLLLAVAGLIGFVVAMQRRAQPRRAPQRVKR